MKSCSIKVAVCVMDMLYRSDMFGVGKPFLLEAMVVMCVSLALFLTDSILKKQVDVVGLPYADIQRCTVINLTRNLELQVI